MKKQLILVLLLLTTCHVNSFGQVVLHEDICVGSCSSQPFGLATYGSKLYFGIWGLTQPIELWSYNGTNASFEGGVNLVDDNTNSSTQSITEFDGKIYFYAGNLTNGWKLWVFDPNSTTLTVSSNLGAYTNSLPSAKVYNAKMYFMKDGGASGWELWRHNGNGPELVVDIVPGSSSSYPNYFTIFNGKLFFTAGQHNINGDALWSYDGSNLVMEANGSTDGFYSPSHLTVFQNKLYFQASDDFGSGLWSYDGSTATLEAAMNLQDLTGSQPINMTVFKDKLYFQARDSVAGREFWSYDGTSATLVADIKVGSSESNPNGFIQYGDKLYFRADDGVNGRQIWSWDENSLEMETDLSFVGSLGVFGNKLFFAGNDGVSGIELWSLYDPAVGITQLQPETVPKTYPNPTDGLVHLDLSSTKGSILINVYNATGEIVSATQLDSGQLYDYEIKGANGVYFIQTVTSEGNVKSTKIMKQ
jgi:ELWxxDGT repeat protein